MTKETYYEMCEMLGTQPVPEEIPVEYSDLPNEVQYALEIYPKFRDDWDSMNGDYMGKNFSGISDIFDILEVPKEDRKDLFDLLNLIDRHRAESIADRKKQAPK